MDDGKTHVTKYPMMGASCVAQVNPPESSFIFTTNAEPDELEECPVSLLQTRLSSGETAIAYPNLGWNCRNTDALSLM